MNLEIGTKAEQFQFWKYLFWMFGIVSLQCEVRPQPVIKWELVINDVSLTKNNYWDVHDIKTQLILVEYKLTQ